VETTRDFSLPENSIFSAASLWSDGLVGLFSYQILDANGRQMDERTPGQPTIAIAILAPGFYILVVFQDNARKNVYFIK
jgi:hypothetical protein